MHVSSLSLLPALLVGTTIATTIPRQDPHIVDFRTYGAPGCSAENQGVYTYTQSDLNTCRTFADATIGSLFVIDITDKCSGESTSVVWPGAGCR